MNITQSKIPDEKQLILLLNLWRFKNEKIIFTNGCFDIIHAGHIHILKEAAKLGTKLIVGLNSDSSVNEIKKPGRPIQNQQSRAAIIAALEMVDAVVLFNEPTPLKLIELVKPDVLVKGGDYKLQEIVGANVAAEVCVIPFLDGYSTSSIEQKIIDQFRK